MGVLAGCVFIVTSLNTLQVFAQADDEETHHFLVAEESHALRIVHQSEDVIWIWNSCCALFRSLDKGATWQEHGYPGRRGSDPVFVDANRGLAVGFNGIWSTFDGGNSWHCSVLTGWWEYGQVSAGGDRYAAAYCDRMLWWSRDFGVTWTKACEEVQQLLQQGISRIVYDTNGCTWVHQEYSRRPLKERLLRICAGGEVEVFHSFDVGSVFRRFSLERGVAVNVLTGDRDIHRIPLDRTVETQSIAHALSDEYVEVMNFGPVGDSSFFFLATSRDGHEAVLLVKEMHSTSWDRRASWPSGQITDIGFSDNNFGIAVDAGGNFLYSVDGGKSWSEGTLIKSTRSPLGTSGGDWDSGP